MIKRQLQRTFAEQAALGEKADSPIMRSFARNPALGTFLFLAGTAVAIAATFWGISRVQLKLDARSWPIVPARIVQSEIKRPTLNVPGQRYGVAVKYQYSWQGKDVEGTSISPTMFTLKNVRAAQRVIEPYPVGAEVTAFVNPGTPSDSYLNVDIVFLDVFVVVPPIAISMFLMWVTCCRIRDLHLRSRTLEQSESYTVHQAA